jgi:myo-inositol 2-dehydrogenase/D-chiro-inositol 1-dehydrogenase
VGVIGAGAIGRYHAESLTVRVPGARLLAIADPAEGAARETAERLGSRWTADPEALLSDPAIGAVVIATPGPTHAPLIVQAARARKHVFCEKPIAWDLESADSAVRAADEAGVLLQIGFQRRFDASFRRVHDLVRSGQLGEVHLMRSITRDPELACPEAVPPWAIFRETLIHDFDLLCWLSGREPVEVFAMAAALVAPERAAAGLRDTAVATIRFAGGAMATVDASFQAVYGYDVRAEVFGTLGMAIADPGNATATTHYSRAGQTRDRVSWFIDLFGAAYARELSAFVSAIHGGEPSPSSGREARRALAVAVAAIESVESGLPARIPPAPGPAS